MLFNQEYLLKRRQRAVQKGYKADFLLIEASKNIASKLQDTNRTFKKVLIIGRAEKDIIMNILNKYEAEIYITDILEDDVITYAPNIHKSIYKDEILPFESESFDLIISPFHLHNISNLPMFLMQIHALLTKNGIFIAGIMGGNSLNELRIAFVETEAALGIGSYPHIHPMIDMKELGMLGRNSGFEFAVSDQFEYKVSYNNVKELIEDLRNMGEGNLLLPKERNYLGKEFYHKLSLFYQDKFNDNEEGIKTSYDLIFLTCMK